jgi:hypothetical protein
MKKVLIVLVVLLLVFLGVVATRPSTFHVERSGTMNAPPAVVFQFLNDFHKFAEWSPWEGKDPTMKKDFSGPNEGVGASYHWVGNKDVGEGRQTITESVPAQKMVEKLEFKAPFEATNTVSFTLKPAGAGTTVVWAMDGEQGFMMKAVSMFMDMDKAVGKDFEEGLAKLKTVSEKQAAVAAAEQALAAAKAAEAAAGATGATGTSGASGATAPSAAPAGKPAKPAAKKK